jgi:uncharacterized protein YcbX
MRLSSIVVYPIKSCGGVSLERARVERRGLVHDRRFLIVEPSGRFVTQREEPRLTAVRVAIDGPALHVEAPVGRVTAAVDPDENVLGAPRTVTVWRSTLDAPEVPALSAFFSSLLGRTLACVAMTRAVHREIDPRFARPEDEVSFADGYPLLVTNEASRLDLEARAGVPLAMARFRPNVVVEGAPAWDEDRWTHLRLGSVLFRATKPCARCVVTTLDPDTGRADKEPLKTLATFRRRDGEVLFGVNLVPVLEGGDTPELLLSALAEEGGPKEHGRTRRNGDGPHNRRNGDGPR